VSSKFDKATLALRLDTLTLDVIIDSNAEATGDTLRELAVALTLIADAVDPPEEETQP
jgi:hypothetical protein